MHIHVRVLWQLIGEMVAHAYACVCVVGSSLARKWLRHMHVCVFWQLICEKVAHAYACVYVVAAHW